MIHYVTFTSGKYLGQKYSYDYWMSHTNFVTKKGDTQTYQSLGRDINDLCLSELLLEAFLFTPTKKRKRERDRERGVGGERNAHCCLSKLLDHFEFKLWAYPRYLSLQLVTPGSWRGDDKRWQKMTLRTLLTCPAWPIHVLLGVP